MKRRIVLLICVCVGIVLLAQLFLQGSVPSQFVMPTPFPSFDPRTPLVEINMPPLRPIGTVVVPEVTLKAESTEFPTWILTVVASWTPAVSASTVYSAIIPVVTAASPPTHDDECGDASVLNLTDDGVHTSLVGNTFFLFFDFDGNEYKLNLDDAFWVVEGEKQKVNQKESAEEETLSEGHVEQVCYYSRTQILSDSQVDKNMDLFQLNGPVLLFPSS